MDLKQLFEYCLAKADKAVHKVKEEQFNAPTPDTEWDVRTLAGHMLYELSWAPDILCGKTISEVGNKYDGDLIGDDLQKSWDKAAAEAREEIAKVDLDKTIHLSFGDFPAKYYIYQEAKDQLIHAWDLGTAIGYKVRFDPDIARDLYNQALPRKDRMASSGVFAPAIDVPDSADIQTKLLALYGRKS